MGVDESEFARGLSKSYLFNNVIPVFPPGTELHFVLATGDVLAKASPDDERTPLVFTVGAAYEFAGRKYHEEYQIDLRLFHNSMIEDHFELKAFQDIVKGIGKVDARIAELTSTVRRVVDR